jgi:hypothetical protein
MLKTLGRERGITQWTENDQKVASFSKGIQKNFPTPANAKIKQL